jgi:hypothetical protein
MRRELGDAVLSLQLFFSAKESERRAKKNDCRPRRSTA